MFEKTESQKTDCSFVICVEQGFLEYKALLLILTLRKNWGKWASSPIYAFSPRPNRKPSVWLREFYDYFNIIPIFEDLNTNFTDYPLANKPLAMAYAEKNIPSEILVFLDTDILCWNEPTDFNLSESVHLKLSPDSTKTVASSGTGDKYESMWQELYRVTDIKEPPWTRTHLTGTQVRNWWISSVIVSRPRYGFMKQWLELFVEIVHKEIIPSEAQYLKEQIAMCLVAAKNTDHFLELPICHNFPIQNYNHSSKTNYEPTKVCLWHYQPFLDKFFRKFKKEFDALEYFDERLQFALRKVESLSSSYPSQIGIDESRLLNWKRRLKIGLRVRSALGITKQTDNVFD